MSSVFGAERVQIHNMREPEATTAAGMGPTQSNTTTESSAGHWTLDWSGNRTGLDEREESIYGARAVRSANDWEESEKVIRGDER